MGKEFMPITLTSIRHGESESNVARKFHEKGLSVPNESELMMAHTSRRRLTSLGRAQAQAAGEWFRDWMTSEGLAERDFRFYVSPYARTLETAGNMRIGNEWRQDVRLVERNWGSLDRLTYEERAKRLGEDLKFKKVEAFFWRPGDGETLQELFMRRKDMMATYRRECSNQHCVQVCHGEVMATDRFLLEYWTPDKLSRHLQEHDDCEHIVNCRIIQYTRVAEDGTLKDKLQRVRFIDPMHPGDPQWNLDWQPIRRPLFTWKQLLSEAEAYPRFLEDFDQAS